MSRWRFTIFSTCCNTRFMATEDEDILDRERLSYGNDSTPLVSLVPDQPPSHWGSLTSQSRTLSPQYLKFLGKEPNDGRAR